MSQPPEMGARHERAFVLAAPETTNKLNCGPPGARLSRQRATCAPALAKLNHEAAGPASGPTRLACVSGSAPSEPATWPG